METKIYNIDSAFRNKTKYPSSTNFTYNTLDTQSHVIPFQEKNVIGINILSIEIPNTLYYINSFRGNNKLTIDNVEYTIDSGSYTCNDLISYLNIKITLLQFTISSSSSKVKIASNDSNSHTILFPSALSTYKSFGQILGFTNVSYTIAPFDDIGENTMIVPQDQYFFLRINDLGNIINNNTKYLTKTILSTNTQYINTNSTASFVYITNTVTLDQPTDIKDLKISIEDLYGNIISLNGSDFSFTLELIVITNTILKNYEQIKFYSEPVMQRILQAKMLAYYEKQISKESNNTITGTYNNNLVNYNNIMEYTPNGNRNDYNNNSSSYYNIMDRK